VKKLISKVLLALAVLAGIESAYMVVYCLIEPVGRDSRILVTLVWLMAFGLFLGLYRIIDLLENR